MSAACFLSYWARMIFHVLEDDFFLIEKAKYFDIFYSELFKKNSAMSHDNMKKQTSLMLKAI